MFLSLYDVNSAAIRLAADLAVHPSQDDQTFNRRLDDHVTA